MKTKDKVTSETYRWQFELTGVMLFPSQIPLKGSELYPAGRKVFNIQVKKKKKKNSINGLETLRK